MRMPESPLDFLPRFFAHDARGTVAWILRALIIWTILGTNVRAQSNAAPVLSAPTAPSAPPVASEPIPLPTAEPKDAGREKPVTYVQLRELGNRLSTLYLLDDNVLLRTEALEKIRQDAELLRGREVEIDLRVMRVTQMEVVVEVIDAGRTRIVIELLNENGTAYFGNPRTRSFCGPPTTPLTSKLASPSALLIGSMVDYDLAHKLRKNDRLRAVGTIQGILTSGVNVNGIQTLAMVGDMRILKHLTRDEYITEHGWRR